MMLILFAVGHTDKDICLHILHVLNNTSKYVSEQFVLLSDYNFQSCLCNKYTRCNLL